LNSSVGKDLNKIKEKSLKIKQAISQFLNNLNLALNGNGITNSVEREGSTPSSGNGKTSF